MHIESEIETLGLLFVCAFVDVIGARSMSVFYSFAFCFSLIEIERFDPAARRRGQADSWVECLIWDVFSCGA